ncbi:MAG: energy-coupling factor ABC transporter permease [Alistipes sp.]|nr:energy-coupling factor ABC transporter permease [Alistipes sp.]
MHMSDALVSPSVAGAVGALSVALLAVAVRQVKRNSTEHIVPLMGVMGAFIFAAQMINFTIPGTGSSGHIVGGVLLSAVLGPWAAFVTLVSVLVLQCLLFADGGLMALGCNVLNMAVCMCLIAYPLIYKPLMRREASFGRILGVSILTCVIGLELGAAAVTFETEASGITMLPLRQFLAFMLPIHLLIGIGEGIATAGVVYVLQRSKPELLVSMRQPDEKSRSRIGKALVMVSLLALAIAGSFSWIASSQPDGLEWSITQLIGTGEPASEPTTTSQVVATQIQDTTALIPDYNTSFAGIVGSGAFLLVAFGLSYLWRAGHKKS